MYSLVDSFVNDIILDDKKEIKHEIVTGLSDRMKELVIEVLNEYKIEALKHAWNDGVMVIKL